MIQQIIKDCGEGWVSDYLKDEIKNWNYLNPVLIHAPTGRGKNQFIIDHLIPFAAARGKKVLLISNRYALNMQQRRQVWNAVGPYPLSQYALEKKMELGHVLVVTYQKIATSNLWNLLENVGYVVFDEAHFFLSDATFNSSTTRLLQDLVFGASGVIRIYMSATPEDILPVIQSVEEQRATQQRDGDIARLLIRLNIYQFAPDYTRYKFSFFNEWTEIIRLIIQSDPSEKWLIFVDTIEEGRNLKSKLAKTLKKKVAFIEASTRKYTETNSDFIAYQKIQQRELFEEQVLISTPVLDNGINIKDSSLKHIVIHSVDRTEVIQMMGRKRLDPGETLTVHFKLLNNPEEISQKMSSVQRLLNCIRVFRNDKNEFWNTAWGNLTNEMQQLFQITQLSEGTHPSPIPNIGEKPNETVCNIGVNLLGEHKLNLNLASLEVLQKLWYQYKGDAIPQLIYQWFEVKQILEAARDITAKKEDALNEFKKWVLNNAETILLKNKEELKSFYEDFLERAEGLYTHEIRDDDDDEKVDRKKSDINNILEELGIPLSLEKSNNTWKLKPKKIK